MNRRSLILIIAVGIISPWDVALATRNWSRSPVPSHPVTGPSPALPQSRVENGERLYKKMRAEAKPTLSSFGAPSVRLVVPKREWARLSRAEQIDITFYAESFISRVRASPADYVDIPPDAPVYRSALNYAQNMCSDCWEIITGELPSKRGTLSVETKVVQGDLAWEADDPCCRGEKASSFRASR